MIFSWTQLSLARLLKAFQLSSQILITDSRDADGVILALWRCLIVSVFKERGLFVLCTL